MLMRILVLSSLFFVGCWLIFQEKTQLMSFVNSMIQSHIDNNSHNDNTHSASHSEDESEDNFYINFKADLQAIKNKNGNQFFKVKSIDWKLRDPEINIEKLNAQQIFELDANSSLILEVEVFSQPDNDIDKTTITQFNYTDSKSQNKVYEFSRMFRTKGKKKPD